MLGQDVHLGQRRADDVVDDAAEPAQFVDVVQLPIVITSPRYSSPRDMPRDLTTKPVALATMACSKLIFEPSAKLVTIAGILPPLLGEAFLRRRMCDRDPAVL